MTIKLKLLGGGITIGVVLITVLLLTIYTFDNLNNGFLDIVSKSDIGVSNARSTETSISKADQSLADVSTGILNIADDINKTNMTIKILERKIKTLAGNQAELAESLSEIVEGMPEGDARYTVEDAVDAVGDIEESMRREALISLSSTVSKMESFTQNITSRVADIKQLAAELNEGKKRSGEVVSANEGIRELSINFGGNISVSRNLIAIVLGVIILLTLISVFFLTRAITRPLARSIQIADGIAAGDLDQKVDIQGKDEFGQLGKAMAIMIRNLKKDINETRNRAEEATRIRLALDVGRTNVLMADTEQKIIYMNESAKNTLLEAEQDLQSVLTDFRAEELIGTDITEIHLEPESRRAILQQLDQEQREDIEIGGRFLRTYTNPVFAENGDRLGIAMEFSDRTNEISIEKEVEYITSAAGKGDLAERLNLTDKEGFFLALGENMNQLLDTVSDAFNNIATTMETMSKGDLSHKITNEYDGTFGTVKNAVNSTIDRLREIVSEVRESSDIISVATREVMQGNTNMSSRTEQQAADLEKIASSTEELTSTVQSNSDNSQTANELANDARKQAENGGKIVGEAITAMTEIRESSQKITEIIGVIDEIAFQTNLLALNASVEAARAGEQGRGFAVVATEVRNLAQRSAGAAKEIKELIMDSEGKVEIGVNMVNHSGKTLESITIAVQKVGDIISEIAASSIEQTRGLEQVNNTMRSMDESTQQNAALAEETSAASVSMGDQVAKMDQSLKFFARI